MKRTFIPPEYRPYVRGTEMSDGVADFEKIIDDPNSRRQLILDLVSGKRRLPGVEQTYLKSLFVEMFPTLEDSNV